MKNNLSNKIISIAKQRQEVTAQKELLRIQLFNLDELLKILDKEAKYELGNAIVNKEVSEDDYVRLCTLAFGE
jgi:hypothetical protein